MVVGRFTTLILPPSSEKHESVSQVRGHFSTHVFFRFFFWDFHASSSGSQVNKAAGLALAPGLLLLTSLWTS